MTCDGRSTSISSPISPVPGPGWAWRSSRVRSAASPETWKRACGGIPSAWRRPPPGSNPRSFHDYLAERLPAGISVPFAEKSLTEAGRELGIDFHFEKLGALPSTSEAHRLVQLAMHEGRHANVAAAIFRAYFERGADIGDVNVLARLGAEAGLERGHAAGLSRYARWRRRCSQAAKSDCAASACAPCRTCCLAVACWCLARSTSRPTCMRSTRRCSRSATREAQEEADVAVKFARRRHSGGSPG